MRVGRLQLQERDFQILRAIAENSACSRANLAAAFFGGSYEAAKKRIQQLSKEGLVENQSRGGRAQSSVCISVSGEKLLEKCVRNFVGARKIPLKPRMVRHERMLTDCRFALTTNADAEGDRVVEFWNDPRAAEFTVACDDHSRLETVRPDGFCSIQTRTGKAKSFFFIEVDRGTETLNHLIHLAKQYRLFWRSGDFAARLGNPYEPKQTTFRVLLILPSERRLENALKSIALHAGVGTLFWLSAFHTFELNPFGPIWRCPGDAENLTSGSLKRCLL